MELNRIYQGDVLEVLRGWPDEFVQCVVTSPPYWGLRDYGVENQLGLEKTPEEYTGKMVGIFREVRRVLRKDGTLWLNMGDCFATNHISGEQGATGQRANRTFTAAGLSPKTGDNLKPKDLVGIPWRIAFALQADGWWLRSDIIWSKPNPMPESVRDRPTKAHEYLFLLTKSARYYYDQDAVREPYEPSGGTWKCKGTPIINYRHNGKHKIEQGQLNSIGRNIRTVWTIAAQPYAEAHFATFPEALVEKPIMVGSAEGDIVLDPFMGSGTVAKVALRAGRRFIGIELNPEYIALAEKRLEPLLKQRKLL